jgi:molybdenum cofactor biosynthesis protein MoaC
MVDVGSKVPSSREAAASGVIILSAKAFQLILQPTSSVSNKGDVLGVARVAGIMAAKQTATLIPLCHTLLLSHVSVDFDLCETDHSVLVNAHVRCEGVTGVEMEALTAVSVALLTLYDMTKSAGKGHVISRVQLETKSGGKSGDYTRNKQHYNHDDC